MVHDFIQDIPYITKMNIRELESGGIIKTDTSKGDRKLRRALCEAVINVVRELSTENIYDNNISILEGDFWNQLCNFFWK